MSPASLPELLTAWREAERHWERTDPASAELRARALEVVAAWLAYQDAAGTPGANDEVMLVADEALTYVAATRNVTGILGYTPEEIIGRRVQDLAGPEDGPIAVPRWEEFLAAGWQDGRFHLRAKDGRSISLSYRARAHHPVPGFHLSRLWSEEG